MEKKCSYASGRITLGQVNRFTVSHHLLSWSVVLSLRCLSGLSIAGNVNTKRQSSNTPISRGTGKNCFSNSSNSQPQQEYCTQVWQVIECIFRTSRAQWCSGENSLSGHGINAKSLCHAHGERGWILFLTHPWYGLRSQTESFWNIQWTKLIPEAANTLSLCSKDLLSKSRLLVLLKNGVTENKKRLTTHRSRLNLQLMLLSLAGHLLIWHKSCWQVTVGTELSLSKPNLD